MKRVSKAELKANALEICREVENTSIPVIITHRGIPRLKIVPFRDTSAAEVFASLRGSVRKFGAPLEPVGESHWELLK